MTEPLAYLKQGATVITPNNRLANELIHQFYRANEKPVLEKPLCFSYQMFLQHLFITYCYTRTSTRPLLLSTHQIKQLWRQMIAEDSEPCLSEGLIHEIQEAWNRCQRWSINLSHPTFSFTPQTRQFQQWAQKFNSSLQQLNAVTIEQLVPLFLNQLTVKLPTTLVWHCFDDYTPEQCDLQQFAVNQGCTIIHTDLAKQDTHSLVYAADNEDDESKELIHWIHDQLAKGKKSLGIIVPDLTAQGLNLQRLLNQQVNPSLFNISLGLPLASYPIVAHALSWLQLADETLTNHEARLLLSSPYLVAAQREMLGRAQCVHDGRILQEMMIPTSSFIEELGHFSPSLAATLKGLTPYPSSASIQQWIAEFSNRLAGLGFPGDSSLNSTVYQCYQRFKGLLEEFRELSLITPMMTKEEALYSLESLAKSTIFQPKNTGSSIQILGLLEASGCLFDSMWVTKMTDECLPQKVKLSAFIPVSLQREKLMPHANPERELSFANKIVNRLTNSSSFCIFSYPKLSLDKPNLPSPLIKNLPTYTPPIVEEITIKTELENYQEMYQLPLSAEEKSSGGTALLANQAKCPFRAFAAHRLHAKKEIATSDGLNAMERGQIIHKVMELLWQDLRDQQTLLSLTSSELERVVLQAIERALEPFKGLQVHSFSGVIQEVEIMRLKRLVYACLDWEKQRPPFTIHALEQTHTLKVGGLAINLRIDRLDESMAGKKWIIDYKTAIPSTLPWREDRPREPQLLLYALLDETIDTLLFTGLKEGQLSCKGLSEQSHDVNGIMSIKKDEKWAELRESWRMQLQGLAEEFSSGHCLPEPINPSLCQQCDFSSLCRFENNALE